MTPPHSTSPRASAAPANRLLARNAGQIVSYRDALFQCMDDALAHHPEVVIFGQGVDDHRGIFGTTLNLHQKYGAERAFDTPLAEEGTAGVALGAALGGLYPIQTHIRVDFALLAMNQIVNQAAKYKYMSGGRLEVPFLMRMIIGRSWGQGSQHSQSLQSLFAHIPGLTVVMPASSQAILEMYPYFIQSYRGPVVSIEHRLLYDMNFRVGDDVADPAATAEPTRPRSAATAEPTRPGSPLASRIVRAGKDVTVVATSMMVLEALRAAEHLHEAAGIDCEIIDLNCISHPDAEMIVSSVRKTGKLLVIDTSWQAYGVCAEVCRIVCERAPQALRAPVVTMGMEAAPCPTAKSLEDLYYPNGMTLVDSLATLVKGSSSHGVALPDARTTVEVYKTFKGPF